MALTYLEKENRCLQVFAKENNYYHLATSEDFILLFKTEEDYKAAMCILGICAKACPGIKIYAFTLMANHIHILISGDEQEIQSFFNCLRFRLNIYYKKNDPEISRILLSWEYSIRRVDSVNDFRNVVAYINRNPYVVCDRYTPFNYRWGTNGYFFSKNAELLYQLTSSKMTVKEIRDITHSRLNDTFAGLKKVDSILSPFEFCHIKETEMMFPDARHYFFAHNKNVETMVSMAKDFGEMICYTDSELYATVSKLCASKYQSSVNDLKETEKIEIAQIMHSRFGSSNKQISRILKLNICFVDSLFPLRKN